MNSGIYSITNEINGKVYYGSTNNFKSRFKNHLNELRANRHKNLHLQRAWNKYGKNNFKIEIKEEIPTKQLEFIEQNYLNWCKIFPFWSYNISYNSLEPNRGVTRSMETRKKMGDAKRGKNHPYFGKSLPHETRRKIGKALVGRTFSKETLKKKSNAMIGKKNHRYGKHLSHEEKQNLKQKLTGRKRSKEFILKMKIAQGGENHSQYDTTIYKFIHPIFGIENLTQYQLRKKYNLNQGNLGQLIKRKTLFVCGWKLYE